MRAFISLLIIALSAALGSAQVQEPDVRLGIQTWTLRNYKFEEVVDFAVRNHIKYLQLIPNHIDINAPKEDLLKKKAILDDKGLVFYTFGVAGTSMDKEKDRKLFEFGKLMGLKIIVVEPGQMSQWDHLEALAKEYNIKLAIHNHGKGSVYGDPETVRKILQSRDSRIGVCLDVGWVTAAGFDAAKVFREYNGRVYDIHFKDKRTERAEGAKDVVLDVELGTGEANYSGLFEALKEAKWSGVMAIESDNATFAKDPQPYVTKGIDFFRNHFKK